MEMPSERPSVTGFDLAVSHQPSNRHCGQLSSRDTSRPNNFASESSSVAPFSAVPSDGFPIIPVTVYGFIGSDGSIWPRDVGLTWPHFGPTASDGEEFDGTPSRC